MSVHSYSASPSLASSGRWHAFLSPIAQRTLAALRALALRVTREAKVRRAIRELSAMDARMLADIGLTRGDIEAVVRGQVEPPYGRAVAADAGVDLKWQDR